MYQLYWLKLLKILNGNRQKEVHDFVGWFRKRDRQNDYIYINVQIIFAKSIELLFILHLCTCLYIYLGLYFKDSWIYSIPESDLAPN
jgi:hypothetical protein